MVRGDGGRLGDQRAARLPWPRAASARLVFATPSSAASACSPGPKASTRARRSVSRLVAQQQRGRKKAPSATPSPTGAKRRRRRTPPHCPGAAAPRARPRRRLRVRGQRAHLHASSAGRPPPPWPGARGDALGHGVEVLARHDGAADGGALLAGLHRHLAHHLLDEEVELPSSGDTSGPRMAQFSESASALNGDAWRTRFGSHAQLAAVSAEPVKVTTSLPVQPVQQVAGAADHQLQAARRAGCRTFTTSRTRLRSGSWWRVAGLAMQGMPARRWARTSPADPRWES